MQKSINDINKNIWVSASAGSGKTKVLIDRFVKLLAEGTDPRHIVCITFTKSAAAEMLERINQTLGYWSICSEKILQEQLTNLLEKQPSEKTKNRARTLLAQMLDVQHLLQIKTIHSFCQTILSKFPMESGIEINSQILEGSDLEKVQFIAQKHTMSEYQCYNFSKQIDYLIGNIHDTKLSEIFAQQLFIVAQYPDFFSSLDTLRIYTENLYNKFNLRVGFNIESEQQSLSNKIFNLAQQNLRLLNSTPPILNAILHFKDKDNLSTLHPYFFTTLDLPKKHLINKKDSSEDILDLLKTIQNILVEFEQKELALKTIRQTEGFLFLGHVFINVYTETKKQTQCLDYSDLLHYTIKLLDNQEVSQWVQYKLHHKIEHLLVDEAQDTNLLQWQIIDQLQKIFFQNNHDKNCTTFVVGDPKQSIYSFQGTSPEIFEGMKHLNMNSNQKWVDCQLNTSYRSDQTILDFIDEVFNDITDSSPNLFYTQNLKHSSSINFNNSSIELLPTILGEKSEKNNDDNAWKALEGYTDTSYEPSKTLAVILARKVQDLLENHNYQPADFLILIRKRDKLTYNIIKEFKKLHIPISGIDRLHLNSSLAIQDLISIANFILLPQDDYNFACLLKSPIFNASEKEIANLSTYSKNGLWHNLQTLKEDNKTYTNYYTPLKIFLDCDVKHRPFDLFIHVLDVLLYRKNFIQYFGHQINEVLDEFLNICQSFQKNDSSLVNFIHWFNDSNIEIKRDVFSNRNEVRLMTVHASKGLQAKYVILPDTTNIPINKNPIILNQSDNIFIYKTDPIQNISEYCKTLIDNSNEETLKEYFRLLYVALTRAKQHILICGWTNKQSINKNSWLSKIQNVLHKKSKSPAPMLMGYKNLNINVENNDIATNYFLSNSENIYYIKKHEQAPKEMQSELEEDNVNPLPAFFKSTIQTKNTPLIFTPSNILQQQSKVDSHTTIGTILHKALELFVLPKKTDNNIIESYLKNNLPHKENYKIYASALNKVIQNIILPQIHNVIIRKEVKISQKYSARLNISAKIDLLILKKDHITIIDYKTTIGSDIPESVYQQLALYFYSISEIYPNTQITCKVISILTQEEFTLNPTTLQNTLNKIDIHG